MKRILDRNLVYGYTKKFDDFKYPYEPYKRLVWDKVKLTNKYSILGAWKTGCMKTEKGKGYKSVDFEDRTYYYTRRWKDGTPAQKRAWEKLNGSNFQRKLLEVSGLDKCGKPTIFKDIKAIDGIGFVYALFVLHCENPRLFPLYDQHVWRAYLYFINEDYKSAKTASQSWGSFEKYSTWFKSQLKSLGDVDPTELDRALWTFGKELKKK
jgi:hypothetical protein